MRKPCSMILNIVIMLLVSSAGLSFAQNPSSRKKMQFPLEFSFFNHATSRPFYGTILKVMHPGCTLGTEWTYREGRYGRLFQNLSAGYYYHEYIAKALFLQSSAGFRFTAGFGLFADFSLGLGYHLSFHPGKVFKLNAEGEYETASSPGRSALIVLGSIGAGYDFSRRGGLPMSFFIRYQPFFQTPYNFRDSWLVQAMLHLGIRLHLW